MKNIMTAACLFVVTAIAILYFIVPAVLGQAKKTDKVDPSTAGPVTISQADGWRTIQFETTQVTAPDVAVTPDGEWLIFTMLGKLFRLSVKGGEAEQLTFGPYYDNDPAISPDGKLVAFQSDRDGTAGNIFILTLASKEIRQLTSEVWADRPAWAPDGQSLVYLQLDRKSWNPKDCSPQVPCRPSLARSPAVVRRVRLAGGELETLRPLGNVWSAFYLPDGRLGWTVMTREKTSPRLSTRVEVSDPEGKVSTLRVFDGIADIVTPSPKADGFYARFSKWGTPTPEPMILFAPISEGAERRVMSVFGGYEAFMAAQGFAVSPDNRTMYLGNHGHLFKVALPGGVRSSVPFSAKVTLAIRQPMTPPKWTPLASGATAPLRTITQLTLSPDGSQIVFRVLDRLWIQSLKGGQARRLVEGDGTESNPIFSPDGSRVVFLSLGDLWEQSIKGGEARRLLKGEGTRSGPAFSPDWRQLAFVFRSEGKREIQVLDFESGKTSTVAPATECGYESLNWSRHGELIAATACDHDILAIDTVAPTVRVLAKTKDWEYWEPYPELSEDGKTLYFHADLPGSDPAFYRLRIEPDAKPEPLAPAIREGFKMKMHGQWLARPVQNGHGIVLSALSGGSADPAKARVLTEPDGHEFSFAPDGSALLYVAGNKLWRQPFKGGVPKEIPIRIEPRVPPPPPLLIERVRVLDYASGAFTAETSLLMENGRIRWIGSADGRKLPDGTVTVDGGGRFAIPGLFDMHGHFACGGASQVAYGVTSVRSMGGRLEAQNAHADRADFTAAGIPRCFYAGRIFEGPKGASRDEDHFFVNILDEDDARTNVRRWKAQGAQFIKFYNMVPWPLQRAAADEAHLLGLPVVAHGYTVEQIVKGVTLGYAGLTHWSGAFYDDASQMFVAAGTSWEPTLGALGGINVMFQNEPQRIPNWSTVAPPTGDLALKGKWVEQLRTVRSAYRRGLTFLPGTDAGPEGLALQWELEFYAEAGIPPIDILRFATKEAAKAVGAQDHLGTLEAGKLADVILLDANPLEDIRNTQKIWRVFKGGWMFDPKVLRPNQN